MPLSLLLLLSLLIFAAEALIAGLSPTLRRTLLRPRPAAVVLATALVLSAASGAIRVSGASGTGTRTSYGFPKPYYFTWTSWEHPISHAGFNWLYFAGNCIGSLALVSLTALLWAAWRARRSANAGRKT
jgi:hypothetical protein